jgi:exopolysaccharide biosynthesis polyprenyl glycosylphosphotransferase
VVLRAEIASFAVVAVVVTTDTKQIGTAIVLLSIVWFVALGHKRYAPWLRLLAPRVPLAAAWSSGVGVVATSLVSFWLPDVDVDPAQLLEIGCVTFIAGAALELAFDGRLVGRTSVVVVGDPLAGSEVAEELRKHPELRFDVVRTVVDAANAPAALDHALLGHQPPDLVVMAGNGAEMETVRTILDAGLVDVRVVGFHGFYEHALGRIPLAGLSPTWFMGVLHLYRSTYPRVTKRTFDCVLAAATLLLLAPLIGAVALLIRLSSRCSVLYRQVRLGETGKTFEILKFRTMVDGAEAPGEAVWAAANDPRITPAGRLLRKTHIDELPQLWNVLRGDMSIVGPRPERPEFLALLEREVPFWNRRHLVKPGITGWAQVQAGYASDVQTAAQKLSYDLYYLKHRSLALDLAIAVKTLAVVFSGAGAR